MQVEQIKTLVYKMLKSASGTVDYTFLAGGFGNSPYLRQCMTEALSDWASRHGLHTCGNGGAAVMKGKSTLLFHIGDESLHMFSPCSACSITLASLLLVCGEQKWQGFRLLAPLPLLIKQL